jgi:mycothiol synthase
MTLKEVPPSGLYLLWPCLIQKVPNALIHFGYRLRTFCESDEPSHLNLLASDGEPMTEKEWDHYRDMLLPNGLFLVEAEETSKLVATAGAVHNPNPGRFYFPFGGELGYLIVEREHRRLGLGRTVCTAVIKRLLSAGYENIRVCVQEHRQPAIQLYLGLGFQPFLHSTEVQSRWKRVCETIGVPYVPKRWPRQV